MADTSAEQHGGHNGRISPEADSAVVDLAMAHMALVAAQRRFDQAEGRVMDMVAAGQATGAQVLGVLARCNVPPTDELRNELKREATEYPVALGE